jgi:hypothetical protein
MRSVIVIVAAVQHYCSNTNNKSKKPTPFPFYFERQKNSGESRAMGFGVNFQLPWNSFFSLLVSFQPQQTFF